MRIFTLASCAPEDHLTLRAPGVAVTYAVRAYADHSRLVARVAFKAPGGRLGDALVGRALALGDLIMMRKQLPDFAHQEELHPPLRLVMALLSWKTRRAARRQGVRYSFLLVRASGVQLAEITTLIDSGGLRPIVDQTYPFDEAPQALAHVEGGRTKGKVVVTMV